MQASLLPSLKTLWCIDLQPERAKQQLAPAYLHVVDSDMRGRDAQSSLSPPRFWPSLQQSSIEICSAPTNIKINTRYVFAYVNR